ncbi:MFS transporter [Streptomyces sp. NPDC051561]|uniref:MFS transporter n=1 Tax=Streptomyces sp. NPDC051561 TaxID=3365658 RepID=UPI00378ABDEA
MPEKGRVTGQGHTARRDRTAWQDRIPGGRDGRRLLAVSLVDKTGSGLWAGTAALYFTYVAGLSVAQVGLLLAISAGVGIAGAPLAGRLADRFLVTHVLVATQLLRALGSAALLLTDEFTLLLAFAAATSLGDRATSVLTKLFAARVSGPHRVRFQAVNRTVVNVGFAIGGLAAAGALAIGSTAAYQALVVGNALSSLCAAVVVSRCAEPARPSRVVTSSAAEESVPVSRSGPWRDRTYLLYTASEAVLFLDDVIFSVGLPLWIIHATDAPHGLAPLLLVLNNVLVVAFQVPMAKLAPDTRAARRLLLPLAGAFVVGTVALAASAAAGTWTAVAALILAATALTCAEMLHATLSWELSVVLAADDAQGAYLGVHGLAVSVQRSLGPLVVSATLAAGPLGWLGLGAALTAASLAQYRLTRDRLAGPALPVPPVAAGGQ